MFKHPNFRGFLGGVVAADIKNVRPSLLLNRLINVRPVVPLCICTHTNKYIIFGKERTPSLHSYRSLVVYSHFRNLH